MDEGLPPLPQLRERTGRHHAAAPYKTVSGILASLGTSCAADCVRFAVLTAARSSEARGATWTEIDFGSSTWTIPASRMKTGREHRVPLSPAAVAILRRRQGMHPVLIFAGHFGKQIEATTLQKLVRSAGVTMHGFRSSFRDWTGEQPATLREVAEAALAHVTGNQTERALFDKRRQLMIEWAAYLEA